MIAIRRSADRGTFDHGWLKTSHTFSFGHYFDPAHTGFRSLRVINDDVVAPGAGFPTHPHRDMEIITYVLSGALAHRDSMGYESVIRAGDFQKMSAGTGIRHSEFNASPTEPVHLYQIWIAPRANGLPPGYAERPARADEPRGRFVPVASPNAMNGTLKIEQDASIHVARLGAGERTSYALSPGRHAWVQMLRGEGTLNGQALREGDGAAVSDESSILFEATKEAEALLFDLG